METDPRHRGWRSAAAVGYEKPVVSTLVSVLVVATLVGTVVREEAPPAVAVDLDWQAPRGCPDAGHVQATIAGLVGQPLASSPASAESSARVRAVVRSGPEGFVVELHTRHGEAEERRTFAAPHCDALADATALIVAVALRPLEAAAASATEALETAREPAPHDRPPAPTPAPTMVVQRQPSPAAAAALTPRARTTGADQPATARPRTVGGALAVTVGPGVGVLPGVAAQLAAALALRGPRWRVEAGGAYWFPRTAGTLQPTVEIGLGSGMLRGCYVAGRSRLELPVCAGAELGAMRGRGQGAGVLSKTSRSLWAAAHAGPGLTWRLGSWVAVRLSVDAIVALRQPGFDVRIAGERVELHRTPPVGGRATLGIELRWP